MNGQTDTVPGVASTGVRAVVLAGGHGSRFSGSFVPKQFVQLRGKPILAYVLETYQNLSLIDEVTRSGRAFAWTYRRPTASPANPAAVPTAG